MCKYSAIDSLVYAFLVGLEAPSPLHITDDADMTSSYSLESTRNRELWEAEMLRFCTSRKKYIGIFVSGTGVLRSISNPSVEITGPG